MSLLMEAEAQAAETGRVLARFDGSGALALCEIAALMCAAPIAGVRLLGEDGEQQAVWHGVLPSTVSAEQTPCSLVIERGKPLVIRDLSNDRRSDGTAWRVDDLRAYAGVPIHAGDGRTLGSVCVLDTEPRDFSVSEMRGLETLATQVAGGLELLRLARQTSVATQERDVAAARERRSQQRLKAVVEGLADGILLVDEDNRTLLANSAFCDMMKLPESPSELKDDPGALIARVLAAPADAPVACLAEIFQGGAPAPGRGTIELQLPGGAILEVAHLRPAVADRASACLWQFRDVTESRRADAEAAQSVERFHALVEASPLAIFALDPSAQPNFVSEGCAVLFGTTGPDYAADGWLAALHEEDHDRAVAAWAEATRTHSSMDIQYRIYDAEGAVQELVVTAAAMHSEQGEFRGWVGTISDVTQQVEDTRALARARRVSERARADLEVRNEELLSLARARDVVLAAVSHEFRTPLTSITTFLEILDEEDELSGSQQQAVAVIARNTVRLEQLVSDLLSAKQEPADIEVVVEAVSLRPIAEEAVGAAILRAREVGVELSVEGVETPIRALADPRRVGQVLDSLLDNALKFTPRGGRISVRCLAQGGRAEIEVSDSGVGIAVEELGRIFDSFYQGVAGRGSGRGSGLGLAIVERILQAQDATIDVRSQPGAGTTMAISFPLAVGR